MQPPRFPLVPQGFPCGSAKLSASADKTAASLAILDRALDYIQSVSYWVTLRWVFYRLFQDGTLPNKGDYKNRLIPASKARKECELWAPDTLEDETRESALVGEGYPVGRCGETWAGVYPLISPCCQGLIIKRPV